MSGRRDASVGDGRKEFGPGGPPMHGAEVHQGRIHNIQVVSLQTGARRTGLLAYLVNPFSGVTPSQVSPVAVRLDIRIRYIPEGAREIRRTQEPPASVLPDRAP